MMQKHIAKQGESTRLSSHTRFSAIAEEPRPADKPVEAHEEVFSDSEDLFELLFGDGGFGLY